MGALWSHQVDQLRDYQRDHLDTLDIALELPTGSGKTLVGLLVGEWRRRSLGQRVVYACPTRQLALQVAEAAARQGIDAHALIDSHRSWDPRQVTTYTRSQSIAVTTYSHIFNSHSHLADAKTLIFDDAHAAEGYVAEAWALEVERSSTVYHDLFDAFGDAIDPQLATRMGGEGADTSTAHEVRLLPLSAVHQRHGEIDSILDAGFASGSDARFRFSMLRANLASCLFYVSRAGWYIRPMIPPTFEHAAYTDPAQRIYLSATLGEAGELERAFGRSPIARIPSPAAWERTGSGRRFFVFPDLAEFDPATDLTVVEATAPDELDGLEIPDEPTALQRLAELAAKRLVLTQRRPTATTIADHLGVPSSERFVASDTSVTAFKAAARGTLIAANRYDGMDLADQSCRFMIMAEVPTASHLQDRFLSGKLRASDVLAERIRTRVVQGAGRCTRGPQDWAVVVILGEELLRYLSDNDNTQSMPVELQAEIEFGLLASTTSYSNLVALTHSALEQDEDWRRLGEPAIADARARGVRTAQPLAAALADSAAYEVVAWRHAWLGDWDTAARAAVGVMEGLTAAAARPYRALWAYFASSWFSLAASAGTPGATARAAELLKLAHAAATGTVWLREVQPLPPEAAAPEQCDQDAITRILALLGGPLRSSSTFGSRAQTMLGQLAQSDAGPYEVGLVELGRFLGADSFKPAGQGRADAAWVWEDLWITLEAKSEQTTQRLSMDYVRQANTHLDSMAADKGVDEWPADSVSTVVAPSLLVDPDAVPIAAPHLHLSGTDVILDIAHDAHRALSALRPGLASGDVQASDLAARTLWDHKVLPTQVRERLTRNPIRGTR